MKLKAADIKDIRSRYAGGTSVRILAEDYGVSIAVIYEAVKGVKKPK